MARPTPTLILLLAAMALAPVAAAQAPDAASATDTQVRVEPTDEPVTPGKLYVMPFEVTYRWPPHGVSNEPTTITVSAEDAPAWAEVKLDPSTFQVDTTEQAAPGTGAKEKTMTGELSFRITGDAPEGNLTAFTVHAQAEANGPLLAASNGTTQVPVRPAAPQENVTASNQTESPSETQSSDDKSVPAPTVPLALAAVSVAAARRRREEAR